MVATAEHRVLLSLSDSDVRLSLLDGFDSNTLANVSCVQRDAILLRRWANWASWLLCRMVYRLLASSSSFMKTWRDIAILCINVLVVRLVRLNSIKLAHICHCVPHWETTRAINAWLTILPIRASRLVAVWFFAICGPRKEIVAHDLTVIRNEKARADP